MVMIAAPARAAAMASLEICSGVVGKCGDMEGVCTPPGRAHVRIAESKAFIARDPHGVCTPIRTGNTAGPKILSAVSDARYRSGPAVIDRPRRIGRDIGSLQERDPP